MSLAMSLAGGWELAVDQIEGENPKNRFIIDDFLMGCEEDYDVTLQRLG